MPVGNLFKGFYISIILIAACSVGFWFLFSCRTPNRYEEIFSRPKLDSVLLGGQPENAALDETPVDIGDITRANELTALIEKLVPLHKRLGKPKKGDWLASHKEAGQTFAQYIACDPERADGNRTYIYVQPLGDFTDTEKKIILLTSKFMSLYFNLQVKLCKTMPLSVIPENARRIHPDWGDRQILAPYILQYVLRPRLPDNAAAYIAFTSSDLWPGAGWNFVYGLAHLRDRVGVWSIYRNGNPDKDDDSYKLCLLRTLKMATHETGHMFTMQHCIKYECNMCGCNNRDESDRNPLALGPECMAKICWATKTNPLGRYETLAKFCKENGLDKEAKFYTRSAEVIKSAVEEEETGSIP